MASPRSRNIILTGAVAAITATGAWYGAGLKTRQEFNQERRAVVESSLEDKISQLETTRERYVKQKAELQTKIDRLTGKGDDVEGEKVVQGR